jgi:hypothetical protein
MHRGVVNMALRERPLRLAMIITACLLLVAIAAQAQVPSVRIYSADPAALTPQQLPWAEVSVVSQAVDALGTSPAPLTLPLAKRFPPLVDQKVADPALRSLGRPPTARVWTGASYANQTVWFRVYNPPTTDPVTGSAIQRYRLRVVPPGVRVPACTVTSITAVAAGPGNPDDIRVIADPWVCGTDDWTLFVPADPANLPTLTDSAGATHGLEYLGTDGDRRYFASYDGALLIRIEAQVPPPGPSPGGDTTYTIRTSSNCWFSPAMAPANPLSGSYTLNGLQWGTGRVELQWQVEENAAGSQDDRWRMDANPDDYDDGDTDNDGEELEFRTIGGVFFVSRALAFVDPDNNGVQDMFLDLGAAAPGASSSPGVFQLRNGALAPVRICPYCGAHVPAGTTSCPYDGRDLATVEPVSATISPRYGPLAPFASYVATPPVRIPYESFAFSPPPSGLDPGEADTNAWAVVEVPTFQPQSGAAPYGLANVDNVPAGTVDDPVAPIRVFTDIGGNGVWDASLQCPSCGRSRTLEEIRDNPDGAWRCTNNNCHGVKYEKQPDDTLTIRSGRPYHGDFATGGGPVVGREYHGATGATTEIRALSGPDATHFQLTLSGSTRPYEFRWGDVVINATNSPIPVEEVVAEDYDTLALALTVPAVTPRLATNARTLDLGKVAPGDARSTVFQVYPAEFSVPAEFAAENRSNYALDGVAGPRVYVQFTDLVPSGVDVFTASPGRMYQAGIIPSSTYLLTDPLGAPVSPPIRPAGAPQVTTFGPISLAAPLPGKLMGLQTPFEALQGNVAAAVPVPNGTPAGTYRGTATAFVDANGNFLADPLEPQTTFQVRLTVTESWLPYNSAVAADSLPAARVHVDPGSGEPNGLQVFWSSNRVDQGGNIPAPANAFWNILYADAVPIVAGPGDPGYRDYQWRTNRPAPAVNQPWLPYPTVPLAGDVYGAGAAAIANSAPTTYQGAGGSSWVAWQRRQTDPSTGNTVSALLFNFDPSPPDGAHERPLASAPVYNTTRVRENPSAFMAMDPVASPPPANHWVFWQAGAEGKTQLYCNARFDPTNPATVKDQRVPLSNALMRSSDPALVTVSIAGSPVTIRKPTSWPYAFVKDASASEYIRALIGGGAQSEINVLYSAWLHSEGNADILWSRFDERTFGDPAANFGKMPFAPVSEQPQADAVRQVFRTMHLDWVTTGPDAALGQVGYAATGGAVAAPDPVIQYWWRDTAGVVTGPIAITWDPTQSQYDANSGVYVLRSTNLVDPVTSMGVTMTVDPTAGIVQFSRHLFNTLNPADATAVFNTLNTPTVADVGLQVSYTPYTYRVTRSPDMDDMPSGFFDTFGRLTVFWRRSRASAEKPFFGQTALWYRTYDLSAHVLQPPMGGPPTVTDDAGVPIPGSEWVADLANGFVRFGPAYEGQYVRITYPSAGGPARTERHLIRGWGPERPVPIESVVSDSPVRVAQETYTIPGMGLQAVRYWLFWTSTRDVYVGGATAQTSDVYYTTVMP